MRTGLLQTIVAREQLTGTFAAATFQRTLDNSDAVTAQSIRLKAGQSGTSFAAARSPRDFIRLGFIQEDGLYAPDADVLLHPDFQAGYCFSIAGRDRRRPTQVGLRFAPPRVATGISQIDGTLWIDTAARVLKDMQFRYLGMGPLVERRRPGGRISFRTMPNGMVVIDDWALRGVATDAYQAFGNPATGNRQRDQARQRMLQRYYTTFETGGELLHARWNPPDSAQWDATNAILTLRLTDKRGRPVAERAVVLDSTDYRATTDSAGVAMIHDLLPGPYQANVEDTLLATLGGDVRGALEFRIARGKSLDTTLKVSTARDLVEDACGDKWADTLTRVVIARVINHDGKSLKRGRWQTADGTFGFTDADGVMSACVPGVLDQATGVPRAATFVLIALSEREDGKEPRMAPLTLTERITVIRLQLPPPEKVP